MKKLLPLLFVSILSISKLFAQCTPPANITIAGPAVTLVSGVNYTAIGCTDRVAVFTVSEVAGATDYEWQITGTSSQTRVSPTKYSIVYEGNNVNIQVTPKNATCSGNTTTLDVTVYQTPNKPNIIQTGSTLDATTTATNYKWYLGSTVVPGATSKTFIPESNGSYIVEAYNATGCSVYSNSVNYFKTAIQEDAIFSNFSFYPNPVTTQLFVNFNKNYDLSFSSLSGQETLQKSNLQGKQEIDLSSLNRGIYLMKVTSDGKTAVRKLLLK